MQRFIEHFVVFVGCFLKYFFIWSMACHCRMKRGAAWHKANLFGVIGSADVTHVLRHGVPMIIRGSESVLGNKPARWEDDEVTNCASRVIALTSKNGEDARIRVVKTNGAQSGK